MSYERDYNINYSYRNTFFKYLYNIGTEVKCPKGKVIEYGDTPLNYVYFIKEGLIKQCFLSQSGKIKTILILKTGDLFGEITMIQEDLDMVFTQAVEDSILMKIDEAIFYKLINQNEILNKQLMLMLTTKFRIIMFQLHDYSYCDTKTRLKNLLIRLSIQHGRSHNLGTVIDLNFTHEELANMVNSTRSTVTKIINELEDSKFIKRTKDKIILLDNISR